MRNMREEMGIEAWEAWDMLHRDGAWLGGSNGGYSTGG